MKAKRIILSIVASAMFATTASAGVILNEFRPNPVGIDPATQDFELLGTPGAAFDGWILSIESDNTAGRGRVDRSTNVSGTFDPNGLLVVTVPDLENPSFTIVLLDGGVGGFTGSSLTDIDTNNDGFADDLSSFVGTVLDALGSPDNVLDSVYGTQLGGTDMAANGTIEPELVFRDSVSLDWYAVLFNGFFDASGNAVNPLLFNQDPTIATFNAVNPTTIPEPTTLALLGLGGLLMLRRRR